MVPFATHYLEGSASIWWDNLREMHLGGEPISWTEFKNQFRRTHIPASLMNIKQKEFLALTQGSMSVNEYLTQFNNLARYAPDDTSTDEKKKDHFLFGLHQAIKTQLSVLQFMDFQAMVNTALISEKEHRTIFSGHKRKFENRKGQSQGDSSRQRNWQPNRQGAPQQSTWTLPRKDETNREKFYAQRSQADGRRKDNACFKCGKPGHYIANCPLWGNSGDLAHAAKPTQVGRVHHITAEEAQQDTEVVLGKCAINSQPALVLFDSGASHSFISEEFAAKHRLGISFLGHRLVVQTPTSQAMTISVCPDLTISINQVKFPGHLNVMSLPGLDAILGMDWLNQHEAQIDCKSRAVTLTNPQGRITTYHPQSSQSPQPQVYLAQVPSVGQVYIVSEYPDVFPEDLPGMPPDREVEFAIEVVPGTNPVFKKHYRMTSPELVELKKQLDDLISKGFI
jgi:hypothetical protein